MPEATICLNDDQAAQLRGALELDIPGDEPPYSDRESLVAYIAQLTTALDRLDRLGWGDVGKDRSYTDDRDRLAWYAARLMEWVDAVALSGSAIEGTPADDMPAIERACQRRQALAPALAGVEILRQLEATR